MSKLTVVFLKDTKHVLAALTRADPPTSGEQVSALVGTALPVAAVDGKSADITVPVAKLDAVTVDDQPEVLLDPQGFQVIEDPQNQQPPKVTSAGVAGSTVGLAISAAGASVTVTNVVSAPSLTALVVLQKVASPSPAPLILVSTVTVGSPTVVAAHSGFTTGETWNMYAFVQTLRPVAALSLTVP